MAGNGFGRLFRFSTFGESHGPAIGCVVDGVPPRIPLAEADIQQWLDRRRPGQSKYTTQRQEPDRVRILSGVFEGQTTGTSIGLLIENTDQRSRDYGDIADKFRPGHADLTYQLKYGIRDYRGGGRSSARETAMRVAAGAIAHQVLRHLFPDCSIRGAMVQLGAKKVNRDDWDWAEVARNPLFCPSPSTTEIWAQQLETIRKAGSSIGAVVEVCAEGIPAGLGLPVYDKLDADLAKAFMSINAVKGVEIGDGFETATLTGEENADEMRTTADGIAFTSNHAGGILGGLSTGQPIIARMAIKPTSSILTTRDSVNKYRENVSVMTKGRHDPCVGIRAVPVAEAMMACVLLDHALAHRAQCGDFTPQWACDTV
jgi:chorismate synthase